MSREIRLDRGRLAKAKRTAQGFVRVDGRLTRTGILEYTRADGSIQRELRPEDEVFKQDSLESLEGVPVTDLHPSTMVDDGNAQELSRGHVRTVRKDGNFVVAEVTVQARTLITKIDTGERAEISCGYSCEYDPTPGVWQGQHFDGVQRNIQYNHVAIGPRNWGRAGSDVALRLDAADAPAHVLVSRYDAEEDDTDFAAAEAALDSYFDDALELPAAHSALMGAGLSHFEADVLLGAHADSADRVDAFNPDQPRDERGRFAGSGGGSGGAKASSGGGSSSASSPEAKRAKALNEIKGRLAAKSAAKAKRSAAKAAPAKAEPKLVPLSAAQTPHEVVAQNQTRQRVAEITAVPSAPSGRGSFTDHEKLNIALDDEHESEQRHQAAQLDIRRHSQRLAELGPHHTERVGVEFRLQDAKRKAESEHNSLTRTRAEIDKLGRKVGKSAVEAARKAKNPAYNPPARRETAPKAPSARERAQAKIGGLHNYASTLDPRDAARVRDNERRR